jgi:Fe-S oxidoreductase
LKNYSINLNLYGEIQRLGAKDMETCMQCGNCSSACPLSTDENTFPRKIYRYLQLGLEDKLLEAPEPWLCYYCGDCNTDCPRGAEPAETMMAARRWLTTQYDWTGLAKKFYASPKWEVGAFAAVALFVISLFLIFHGPVVTDRVELNTFAPAHWVHIGDQIMIVIVFALLGSNAVNMYFKIMQGTKVPLHLLITQAPVFIINYFTQKKGRECGTGISSAWARHFLLFSGWVAMEVLVMIFLMAFQTDIVHPFWHPTRIVGYYATIALMIGSGSMLYSRWKKKQEKMHRYSDFTDFFFLILIFTIAVSGILVHFARLGGLPLTTYTIYVVHVGICVGMLMIMLPFGKLSHLMYRPLAIFLTAVKAKAQKDSQVDFSKVEEDIGDAFKTCMQCGTCTSVCPSIQISNYSPRLVLRNISLNRATDVNVDEASWSCVTCNSCVEICPRGIGIIDLIKTVREQTVNGGHLPSRFQAPVKSLTKDGNPWGGKRKDRFSWTGSLTIPLFTKDIEYCLFTCCTTAYDTTNQKGSETAGLALIKLFEICDVSYGTLGDAESCCGDQAEKIGAVDVFDSLTTSNTELFVNNGVEKILTSSPHCLNTFKNNEELQGKVETEHYTELLDRLITEGRLTPLSSVNQKVTYHDPCYLGRHNGIYEAPRRILASIPGIELIEMQNSRQRSLCCGGGGGGAWQILPVEDSHGVHRVREALANGAEIIATACPYCIRMLNDAIQTLGVQNKIQVRDVSELLLQSVEASFISDKNSSTTKSTNQEEYHV